MRKLYISLGLALLLLLVQQGAVLHEVSHINASATHVQSQLKADVVLDKGCQLCLAFSQVANPAGNTVSVTYFEPSACTAELLPSWAVIPHDVLNPRSRGPPLSEINV